MGDIASATTTNGSSSRSSSSSTPSLITPPSSILLSGMGSTFPTSLSTTSMPGSEDLAEIQGLSLNSPVKPSAASKRDQNTTSSSTGSNGRASSSEPSSSTGSNNEIPGMPMFVQQEGLEDVDDDDEDGKGKKGQPNPGRRKIEIEYIDDKSKRHITFSKRKAGIMKKAYELSTLTGTQVLLLVVSETGLVYTYTTNKLQPLVTAKEGKALIQACLIAEDGEAPFGDKNDNLPGLTPTRTRADHRKVSMQVRVDPSGVRYNSARDHLNTGSSMQSQPGISSSPMPSPSYAAQSLQQQQAMSAQQMQAQQQQQQQHMPQMMQSPTYLPQQNLQQQQSMPTSLLPPAQMGYGPSALQQQPQQSNLMPLSSMSGMPPIPSPSPIEPSNPLGGGGRTIKKRKTVENIRGAKESSEEAELRRTEATQAAQEMLNAARQNPTLSNLIRAYQQHDMATRPKPTRLGGGESQVVEGLDSTIQLFQMACEDGARGPEADQARLRGERWMDHVGVNHLSDAVETFLHDFLVNKCIRTAKDVKAHAKDISNFCDWLFAHSFIGPDLHAIVAKQCGGTSTGKSVKKKASEHNLVASAPPPLTQINVTNNGGLPNGLVHGAPSPAVRAETAGKTLIEYCEFARSRYEGIGQEQGITALNGYFVIDRVRQTYCILRGVPIEGDPHSNSEPGPFKVRMPRSLTMELRPRDQFLLSLNRYPHMSSWVPTACGDVHPTSEEDMPEDPLNSQYYQMEAEKAQRMGDQMTFNYHFAEYQFATKVQELLNEGELPEDGFGGVNIQQVLHSHASQSSLNQQQQQQIVQQQQQEQQRAVRRQPSRARVTTQDGTGWTGSY